MDGLDGLSQAVAIRQREQLYEACRDGDLTRVQALTATLGVNVQFDKVDPSRGILSAGATPLMVAARFKRDPIVKYLLKQPQIDVNKTDSRGMTAILASMMAEHPFIFLYLAFDPRVSFFPGPLFLGVSLLTMTATFQYGGLDYFGAILCSYKPIPDVEIQKTLARLERFERQKVEAIKGAVAILREYLKDPYYVRTRQYREMGFEMWDLAFASACAGGAMWSVISSFHLIDINFRHPIHMGREPPLMRAIYEGNSDVVKCLVANTQIDTNRPGLDDWTPLMAAMFGKPSIVLALVQKKSTDVNKRSGKYGHTALSHVLMTGFERSKSPPLHTLDLKMFRWCIVALLTSHTKVDFAETATTRSISDLVQIVPDQFIQDLIRDYERDAQGTRSKCIEYCQSSAFKEADSQFLAPAPMIKKPPKKTVTKEKANASTSAAMVINLDADEDAEN